MITRHHLWIIMVLISFSKLNAQTYTPTLVEGRQWTVLIQEGLGGAYHFDYILDCDTTINNLTYYPIKYINTSTPEAYVREDLNTQQIFYWHKNSPQEELMIDYSLAVGDTFTITPYNYSFQAVVSAVNIVQGKKEISFGNTEKFTEGEGTLSHGVFQQATFFAALASYRTNIQDLTPPCLVSINAFPTQDKNIHIYPNPFQESIQLEWETFPSEPPTIQIYNMMGKLLKTEQIYQNKAINLSNLPSGVYLLQINNTKSIKLVKH